MPEADTKERKILIVKNVANVGGKPENPVVSFSAVTDRDDAVRGYETWGKELVEAVKSGERLDCEVTYKKKGDDLINRVTQIWDAKGNPLRKSTRRSQSQNMQEVAAAFQEGAAMICGAVLMGAGILDKESPAGKKVFNFIQERIAQTAGQPAGRQQQDSKPAGQPASSQQQDKKPAGSQQQSAQPAGTGKQETTQGDEKLLSQDELQNIHDEIVEAGYTKETIAPLLARHRKDKLSSLKRSEAEALLKDVRNKVGLI